MKPIIGSILACSLASLCVITILINVSSKDSSAQEETNIVGMWLFEGDGDVIVDSSGNGHDGEMFGGVKRTDDGKFGNAVWFDGTDDHIDIPDVEELHQETFTLLSWFQLDKATGSWQTIFGKQSGGVGLIIEVAAGGVLNTGFGGGWLCTGTTRIDDGKWRHVASVFDGKSVQLYIDGSLDMATDAGTRPPENDVPLRIGGSPDIGEMFSGPIDEVAFFDVPLTEEEIQTLMQGFEKFLAMESEGKLAATWSNIKCALD
jgi:hypothetical protein